MKVPLINVFGAITRRDDEARIVEGYCFVNEECGDGFRLRRSAMEEATHDYLTWGAVREMHSKSAAGTSNDNGQTNGLGVFWDKKGAFFRCKVVDDAAWKKVTEGVYKGFSVGVVPQVMRGKDVTRARWSEVSLVDRPADPDAVASIARSEAWDGSLEVEAEEESVERGMFADRIDAREKEAVRNAAWYLLDSCLWDIQFSTDLDKAAEVRRACSEFADYIAPIIARGDFGKDGSPVERLEAVLSGADISALALERAETSRADAETRLVSVTADLERVQGLFDSRTAFIERLAGAVSPVDGETEAQLIDRVESLLKEPPRTVPLKVTAKHLVERLTAGPSDDEQNSKAQAADEYAEIMRTDWSQKSDDEKRVAFLRIEELKQALN